MADPFRFTRTHHLVELIATVERLAALVAQAPASAGGGANDPIAEAASASVDLDGAPEPAGRSSEVARIRALELRGVEAGLRSDDLAGALVTDPVPALEELHRRLVSGLVAPDRAGRPRTSEQAVHDASLGRVIYFPSRPAAIRGELELLGAWLASTGAREHGLVASGVLHYELLRIHPFEAANGRLARCAARLVLRARGLDPGGLAAPEAALAADPLGYHEEVARTRHRADLSIWLERWGEAVGAGLRRSARRRHLLSEDVPERAEAFVAGRAAFTITDYRAEVGVGPAEARADLEALLDAGRVRHVPGGRGLRFTAGAGG